MLCLFAWPWIVALEMHRRPSENCLLQQQVGIVLTWTNLCESAADGGGCRCLYESLKVKGSHIPDLLKGNVNSFGWLPVAVHLWRTVRFAWAGSRLEELFVCVCACLTSRERKNEVNQTNAPTASELVRAKFGNVRKEGGLLQGEKWRALASCLWTGRTLLEKTRHWRRRSGEVLCYAEKDMTTRWWVSAVLVHLFSTSADQL